MQQQNDILSFIVIGAVVVLLLVIAGCIAYMSIQEAKRAAIKQSTLPPSCIDNIESKLDQEAEDLLCFMQDIKSIGGLIYAKQQIVRISEEYENVPGIQGPLTLLLTVFETHRRRVEQHWRKIDGECILEQVRYPSEEA